MSPIPPCFWYGPAPELVDPLPLTFTAACPHGYMVDWTALPNRGPLPNCAVHEGPHLRPEPDI